MEEVVISSISAKEIVIKGSAVINNPSKITYKVTGGEYDLSIEGLALGQIEHELEASLLPNTESTIPLIIKLATKDLPKKGWFGRALGIIASQQATIDLNGHFTLNIKGAKLPIPVSFTEKINIADYAKK